MKWLIAALVFMAGCGKEEPPPDNKEQLDRIEKRLKWMEHQQRMQEIDRNR